MNFLTGAPKNSWQPIMTGNTTLSSYWLNWRVLLCSLWILLSLVVASILVSKYECRRNPKENREREKKEPPGILYEDDVWRPCLRTIHPGWLLGYRVVAFIVLLLMLILNAVVDGGDIFYYYTQWTFTLVTIYFGIGSLLSVSGCCKLGNKVYGRTEDEGIDAERGITNGASMYIERSNVANGSKHLGHVEDDGDHERQIAGFWGYVLQIVFQTNAGAVMLTDIVFWFVIVPFLTIKDYSLNFLVINMHSINVVFLLGETALNSLRFPLFRIAYFFLWTAVYVIFQWIVHACISIWWPYPFLDLSSSFSPLGYSTVALMHIPCFGVFFLIMKLKHYLLSKYFPQTYQSTI